MLFLLGAVGCTSLVNIVLALASRRGWDGRAVLGWNYLASAAAAGLLAAQPFLLCGLVCLLVRRQAGLWCGWIW